MDELSRKELAELCRLSTRQIANLEREGMPHIARKNRKFYPPAAVVWYWERKVEEAREKSRRDAEAGPDRSARARKLEADARLAEITVAKLEGDLIPIDMHETRLGAILDGLRARIVSAPGVWAPRIVGVKSVRAAVRRLKPLSHELLDSLASLAAEIDDNAA